MKFKAQDKQNQLIENITVNHLVIGVDIAQETHVARAVIFAVLLWVIHWNLVMTRSVSYLLIAGSVTC
jgi:hypothetical protein